MDKTNEVLEANNHIRKRPGEIVLLKQLQKKFIHRMYGEAETWECLSTEDEYSLLNFLKREGFTEEDYLEYGKKE